MVLIIILAMVITGLVLTLAWVAGQQAQSAAAMRKMDQAFFAAEAGAQQVGWYCKNGKMNLIASPLTGVCNRVQLHRGVDHERRADNADLGGLFRYYLLHALGNPHAAQ